MSWKTLVLGIGLALLALGPGRIAAAEETDQPPSKWEFEFAPYGWLAGNYGTATVQGHSTKIDVSPIDVYHLLVNGNAFAGAAYLSARYDRFSVFADSMGGYVEERVTEEIPTALCNLAVDATGKVKLVIADFGIGYELGRWTLPKRQRPLTLGVYAGARYMYFNVKLKARGGVVGAAARSANVGGSWAWADPLIGVRWQAPVLDRLSLDFRADIGGFGASSDLAWGIMGGIRYWLPWTPWSVQPWLGAGYKAISFDRTSDAGNSLDLEFRGPYSGAGFVF